MNDAKGNPVFKVIKAFRVARTANINPSLTLKLRQSSTWFSHMVFTLADEMLEGFGRPLEILIKRPAGRRPLSLAKLFDAMLALAFFMRNR